MKSPRKKMKARKARKKMRASKARIGPPELGGQRGRLSYVFKRKSKVLISFLECNWELFDAYKQLIFFYTSSYKGQ